MILRTAAALLILAASAGAAAPDAPLRADDAAGPPLRHGVVHPIAPSRAAIPQFANPAFEDIGPDGHPAGWARTGSPEIREEPDGNRFARVNLPNRYSQSFASPGVGRHIGLSVRARGELGAENLMLQVFQLEPDGRRTFQDLRQRGLPPGQWTRLYHSFALLPGTMTADIYGLGLENWVDLDDAAWFDEGLGAFEDPTGFPGWEGDGGAQAVGGELLLPAGASASRIAASADAAQEYFVRIAARAESGAPVLAARTEWLSSDGAVLGASEDSWPVAGTGTEQFAAFHAPAPGTHAGRVVLSAEGGGVVVESATRGFVQAFPRVFERGASSINPELVLRAAAPGALLGAEVDIVDGDGAVVATLVLDGNGDARSAAWDGGDAAPGAHAARFVVVLPTGVVEYEVPFELRDAPPATPPAPFDAAGVFPRWAWAWILPNETTPAQIDPVFAAAAADGYNGIVVFGGEGRWDLFAASAEAHGLAFIPADRRLDAQIRRRRDLRPFSRLEYEAVFDAALSGVLGSPAYAGHYAMDEPEDVLSQRNTGAAMRIAGWNPDWRVPLATMSMPGTALGPEAWDRVATPIHWVDPYPFNAGQVDSDAALRGFSSYLRAQRAQASSRGRELWLVQQGFSSPDFYRTVDPAALRAMTGVALAAGVRGFATFLWRALNQLDGVRGRFLEETALLPVAQEMNARLDAAGPALLSLHSFSSFGGTATGPVIVGQARDPQNRVVLFVVSTNLRSRTAVSVPILSASPMAFDLVEGAPLPINGALLDLDLAPGDWRVVRFDAGSPFAVLATAQPRRPAGAPMAVAREHQFAPTPRGLRLSPDGGTLAVFAGGAAHLVGVGDGAVRSVPAREAWSGAFGPDGLLWIAERAFGVAVLDWQDPASVPARPFARESGGAYAVLPDGDGAWTSGYFLGVRRLAGDGASLSPVAHGSNPWLAVDLFGPFDGGAVLYLDTQGGLVRALPDGDGGLSQATEALFDRGWRGDLDASGSRLAVARQRRGFSLHDLAADGRVLDSRFHPLPIEHAVDIAWIDDATLLAGDAYGDLAMIRLEGDGAIATHLVDRFAGESTALQAVAAWPGGAALAYASGRVLYIELPSPDAEAWRLR